MHFLLFSSIFVKSLTNKWRLEGWIFCLLLFLDLLNESYHYRSVNDLCWGHRDCSVPWQVLTFRHVDDNILVVRFIFGPGHTVSMKNWEFSFKMGDWLTEMYSCLRKRNDWVAEIISQYLEKAGCKKVGIKKKLSVLLAEEDYTQAAENFVWIKLLTETI